MKPVLFTFLLSCVLHSGLLAQQEVRIYDPGADAADEMHLAVKKANAENKHVLIIAGGNWCSWCITFDHFIHADTQIDSLLNKTYVIYHLNFSKENENKEFLSHYPKVPGYPHFFVLESDGTFLYSQDTGELESGQGHDHDKVLAFLKRWAPK